MGQIKVTILCNEQSIQHKNTVDNVYLVKSLTILPRPLGALAAWASDTASVWKSTMKGAVQSGTKRRTICVYRVSQGLWPSQSEKLGPANSNAHQQMHVQPKMTRLSLKFLVN